MIGSNLSSDIIEFFKNIPIFSHINMEELWVVAKHMNVMTLKPDDVLFKESEKGNYVCFIKEGELDVMKRSEVTGREVTLATLGPGQSIGEMSIIDDQDRSATIKAKNSVTLYILSKSAFELILDRHARIGIKLLKGISVLLSNNLRETSSKLVDHITPLL